MSRNILPLRGSCGEADGGTRAGAAGRLGGRGSGVRQHVLTLGGVSAEWIGALDGAIILLALVLSRITSGQAQD